jgi:CrcB protein
MIALAVLAFAAIAAIGTALRVQLALRANQPARPMGTLAANLVGSLLAGLAVSLDDPWATVVVAGGAGALTTFSTFIGELVELVRSGRADLASGYALTTLGACTSLAWLGLRVTA